VRAEHDRLLDVAGARRSRDEFTARGRGPAHADQRERLFHPRHDALRAHDGDVRVDEQRGRGRAVRAGEHDQRARSAIAQNVPVMPRRSSLSSARLDGEARATPVEVGELGPADACLRSLRVDRGRQHQRIDVARNRGRNLTAIADALDGALHVGRAAG
jgi:hypothetical protein